MFASLKQMYPDAANDIEYVRKNHAHWGDLDALHTDFVAWRRVHEVDLDTDFKEESGEVATVRGVKVRGVFASEAEVRRHVDRLRALDKAHDIYVTEVGAWAPWDPSPVANGRSTEYAEEKLNDLARRHEERREAQRMRADTERASIRDRIRNMGSEDAAAIETMKQAYASKLTAATDTTAAADANPEAGPSQQ